MHFLTSLSYLVAVARCYESSNSTSSIASSITSFSTEQSSFRSSTSSSIVLNTTTSSSVVSTNGTTSTTTSSSKTLSSPTLCTSSDLAVASQCSSSWASWSSASSIFLSQHFSTYTTTTTIPPLAPLSGTILGAPWAGFSKPESICNGIPRFVGGWTATGTSSLSLGPSSTIDIVATATISAFPNPAPTCCVGPTDCLMLKDEWHAINLLPYPSNGLSWSSERPSSYPHCNGTGSSNLDERDTSDCSGCWLVGSRLQIYYWPRDTELPPRCAENYIFASAGTTTSNATGPATTVVTLTQSNKPSITTLTSPTVYMAVSNAQGRDGCQALVGAGIATTIFPLGVDELKSAIIKLPGMTDAAASSSVASVIAYQQTERFSDLFGVGWQQKYVTNNQYSLPIATQDVDINFADMGKPLPFLSYYLGDAGHRCLGQVPTSVERRDVALASQGVPCNSMFDFYTQARIKLGTMLRSADPSWATCQMDYASWLPAFPLTAHKQVTTIPDAPIALSSAPSVAKPTLPSSASPGSTSITVAPTFSISAIPLSTPNLGTPTATAEPMPDTSRPSLSPDSPPATAIVTSQPDARSTTSVPDMPDAPVAPTVVVVIGSSTVTARQSQPLVVGSHTITAGGNPTSIDRQLISVGHSAVVVGDITAVFPIGATATLPIAPSAGQFLTTSVNGQEMTFMQPPGGSLVVVDESKTLTKGESPTTINGQELHYGSSGIAFGPLKMSFPPDTSAFITTATVNGHTYTISALPGGTRIIDGAVTLAAGAAVATLANGDAFSVEISGDLIADASTIIHIPKSAQGVATTATVLDGEKYTISELPNGDGVVIDGSITLSVSGPVITLPNGEVLSAGPSEDLVIGSSTILHFPTSCQVVATTAMMDGEKYTISELSNGLGVVVDGAITLTEGGAATTLSNGDVLTAGPSSDLLIESSTLHITDSSSIAAVTTTMVATPSPTTVDSGGNRIIPGLISGLVVLALLV